MIYKTGDKHERFERGAQYCDRFGTSSEDGEAFDFERKAVYCDGWAYSVDKMMRILNSNKCRGCYQKDIL